LLERESAAILNESLKNLCHDTITAFRQALDDVGFPENCPFYLSQNDGTLIRLVGIAHIIIQYSIEIMESWALLPSLKTTLTFS